LCARLKCSHIADSAPSRLTLADRIAVMNEFQIIGELANSGEYGPMSQQTIRLIPREADTVATHPELSGP
jgi:ribose transport system ATP-binding protein